MTLKGLRVGTAALACAVLAACGTATVTTGAKTGATPSTTGNPLQQAKADAAAMLAAFVPPPGATRLSSAPTGSGGVLADIVPTPGPGNQFDDSSFWRVPASAGSVLAFEVAHLPRQFTLLGEGNFGKTTPGVIPAHPRVRSQPHPVGTADEAWYDEWTLPPVPGVIYQRKLTVNVTDPSSSVTYVRVDSNVGWIPVRPASDKVPAGVTLVTITASPDQFHPKGTPAPVTVTDPAKVRRIVAALDDLPLLTVAINGYPADFNGAMTLTFRARPGGQVLATAYEPIPNCGHVRYAIGGVPQPDLWDWGTFISKVLAIAGVHWPSWYI